MADKSEEFTYPRRRAIRFILRRLAEAALFALTDFTLIGKENIPRTGPIIVAANHFHFSDPPIVMRSINRNIEFLGGGIMPDAPKFTQIIPKAWGYYPVMRGGASRTAIRASQAVLGQDGFLGIFPEGGSWAPVLKPARPGTAFIAVDTQAPILPIGIDGAPQIFKERRPKVTVRIGKPIGPFQTTSRGKARRKELADIGDTIMLAIRELIPAEVHGVYSDDIRVRESAEKVAAYPYDNLMG